MGDDALSKAETAILIDGLTDDISFACALIHLGVRANPGFEAPASEAIAAAFDSFDRLVSQGLVRLGRIEYVDPSTPQGTLAAVRHVDEPFEEVRKRVEHACRTAKDFSDWAFCCWLVNTDAGDALARLVIETDA